VKAAGLTIGVPDTDRDMALRRACAVAIRDVTADMSEKYGFNTSIAALMKLANVCSKALQDGVTAAVAADALATIASLLLPFAPHLASEVYHQLTGEFVWKVPWPVADEDLLKNDFIEIICQVNGKVRDRLVLPADADNATIEREALRSESVQRHLDGRSVEKIVIVPGRLVNVVG
jgi:leucyl-tRNA synthetase